MKNRSNKHQPMETAPDHLSQGHNTNIQGNVSQGHVSQGQRDNQYEVNQTEREKELSKLNLPEKTDESIIGQNPSPNLTPNHVHDYQNDQKLKDFSISLSSVSRGTKQQLENVSSTRQYQQPENRNITPLPLNQTQRNQAEKDMSLSLSQIQPQDKK